MSLGMGFWLRGQVEICLMGVKGKIKAFRCQKPNFIQTKVRTHSQKPDEMRSLIEEATKNIPDRRMIELFARESYPGWICIGKTIDGKDVKEMLSEGDLRKNK